MIITSIHTSEFLLFLTCWTEQLYLHLADCSLMAMRWKANNGHKRPSPGGESKRTRERVSQRASVHHGKAPIIGARKTFHLTHCEIRKPPCNFCKALVSESLCVAKVSNKADEIKSKTTVKKGFNIRIHISRSKHFK